MAFSVSPGVKRGRNGKVGMLGFQCASVVGQGVFVALLVARGNSLSATPQLPPLKSETIFESFYPNGSVQAGLD